MGAVCQRVSDMALSEQIQNDLGIFFNDADFGTWHTVAGRKLLVIVDTEQAKQDGLKDLNGNYSGDITVFAKQTDLQGLRLEPEQAIIFDNVQYVIVNINPIDGIVELNLNQRRGFG